MTNAKIFGAIVLVAAAAVAGFFIMERKGMDTTENADQTTQQETRQPAGKKMAFSQFIKQGGSYKCTVHQYVNDTDTVGTTYINDGMVRGEYSVDIQGKKMEGVALVRDGYSYAWSTMMPGTGFKTKIVENTETGSMETSGTYSYSTDQIGDYDCQPWTADVSLFAVPADVTFREI